MGAIFNEITSNNLMTAIAFNQSYTLPPTQVGTSLYNTGWASDGTNTPVYNATGGPSAGEGSWYFNNDNSVTPNIKTRVSNTHPFTSGNNEAYTDLIEQCNYTVGLWIKVDYFNNLITGSLGGICRAVSTSGSVSPGNIGYYIGAGNDGSEAKNAFGFITDTGLQIVTQDENNNDLLTDRWYYLAFRKTTNTGNGTNNSISTVAYYINGYKFLETNSVVSAGNVNQLNWGITAALANFKLPVHLANWHLAHSSDITEADIQAIYAAGPNKFFNAEPMTATAFNTDVVVDYGRTFEATPAEASALQTEPTVVIVANDNVEIATSIPVSATMVDAVFSDSNDVTVSNATTGSAEAELRQPRDIETDRITLIGADVLTATATMTEAKLTERPMNSSASFPMPTIFITPNYYAAVMKHNPVLYVEDGQAQPVNHGSWTVGTWTKEYIDADVLATGELQAVGNQKAWKANAEGVILHEPTLHVTPLGGTATVESLYNTRALSIELWYKSNHNLPGETREDYQSGILYNDGITLIGEVRDIGYSEKFYRNGICEGIFDENKTLLIGPLQYLGATNNTGNPWKEWTKYGDANPNFNEWNHVVITYEPLVEPGKMRQMAYLNGALIGNEIYEVGTYYDGYGTFDPITGLNSIGETRAYILNTDLNPNESIYNGIEIGSSQSIYGSGSIKLKDGTYIDEVAIYPKTLSYADVAEHYSFIQALSPEYRYFAEAIRVDAASGDHVNLSVQNFVYEETPMSALAARIPDPIIIGGIDKSVSVDPLLAEATLAMPVIAYDITYTATPLIAYAEKANSYFLSDIYSQYVQANIAPYRYVTFNADNAYLDYGTDNDYSVAPVTVGGTIVNPDLGINGKSAKTAGTSYITDGVIFNESEYDDTWGTGQNSYHSAFWFQRAIDDQSTTGLRVLWNLNGYYDNQHVVLYQYQGKLHMQFNNGSGTWIEQDTGTLDLFDYQRHFVVIEFDHTNVNNNIVRLYVDAVLKMTVSLGAYTGETINSYTQDSGPNDEANNYPRLSVGCLITPFAASALPVMPANTKLIVDEIYWDKNAITQTMVTNLYNIMPLKINVNYASGAMTASALMVDSANTTNVNFLAGVMGASAELVNPSVLAVFNTILTVDPMLASADDLGAQRIDNVNYEAVFMFASAFLGGTGLPRVVNAPALTATGLLASTRQQNAGIRINGTEIFEPESAWVKYIKATTQTTLVPMKEVL